MTRKISITQKHFLYFLLLFLVSILAVGSYSYYVAKVSILERTFNQLESVRVEKTKSIKRYFADRTNDVELFASLEFLKELAAGKPAEAENLIGNSIRSKYNPSPEYYKMSYFIFDDFIALTDNKTDSVSFLQNDSAYLQEHLLLDLYRKIKSSGKTIIQDFRLKRHGNISFYIGTPVREDVSGKIIGVIVLELYSSCINQIMYDRDENNGLGKSGESYIVGQDLLMRTTSRFKENSIKKLKVETDATKAAFLNKSGTGVLKDYRNVLVLSSYSKLNISDLHWLIIAEIDQEEALKPIYDLRNSIIILCLIVSIFIFGFVYLGSITITSPILMLKDAAIKISQGDYKIRIASKTNDEIAELIAAFNIMAEQLAFQSEQIKREKLVKISSMIDALELERKRLSRDLHDGLGQMLLAVKIKLEQSKNPDKLKSSTYFAEAIELLQNAINEIRTISNDLTPTVLGMFGLEDGIKKLCRDIFPADDFEYQFVSDLSSCKNMDEKKQIYIFRIFQEIVNNIQKHSEASMALINISSNEKGLHIVVEDNGRGFDINTRNIGNGINNIYERVELLGGECGIDSRIGKGTIIWITIPAFVR